MQLKLQLERQITELRSRVQELEMALVTARQEHAELMEQYKVGVGPGRGQAWVLTQCSKSEPSEEGKAQALVGYFWNQRNRLKG